MSKEVQVETVLLPCPFCGGLPKVFYELHDLDDYVVQCGSCGASSCPVEMRYDKDLAIIDWNKRYIMPKDEDGQKSHALLAGSQSMNGWRWVTVGEKFSEGDTINTVIPIPCSWVGSLCTGNHMALRRVEVSKQDKQL